VEPLAPHPAPTAVSNTIDATNRPSSEPSNACDSCCIFEVMCCSFHRVARQPGGQTVIFRPGKLFPDGSQASLGLAISPEI